MEISPLTAMRPRPVALVVPGHRTLDVVTADGHRTVHGQRDVETVLATLAKWVVYTPGSITRMKYVTSADRWTCHTWRGRGTRMVHEPTGAVVTSLRGAFDGQPPDVAFKNLTSCLEWLYGYGVPPGSISAMAWNLFRASLGSNVTIGADPTVSRSALFGGRQEVHNHLDIHGRPRVLRNMVAYDIRRAYPTSMASHPYAHSLRSVHPSVNLDPTVPGLASARVMVPNDLPFAPLPVRLAPEIIQFQRGPIEGTWAWCELAAAQDLGCEVEVTAAWAPRATRDLFAGWWTMVRTMDKLPPGAQQLGKAVSNSLWGQFAMDGTAAGMTRWADAKGDRPYHVDKDARRLPNVWAAHLAAETTARVRTRLLLEGLYGDRFFPVHADTDGMIVRGSRAAPFPAGDGPGHWRAKAAMRTVDIRGPQLYRWTCGKGCGVNHRKWHYVTSGVPASSAEAIFESDHGRLPTPISYRGVFDAVVPTTHSADRKEIDHLVRQVREREGITL